MLGCSCVFSAHAYYESMETLLRYLGTVAAVLLTMKLVPGIEAPGWATVFLVAFVWSLITLVIRPVLKILTLPITILTLGLFSLILNTALFYAMTWVVPGFTVAGFWSAFLGVLVLSVITWLLNKVI